MVLSSMVLSFLRSERSGSSGCTAPAVPDSRRMKVSDELEAGLQRERAGAERLFEAVAARIVA